MSEKQDIINRLHNDFIALKLKESLNNEDLSALETSITGLLGIYRMSKSIHLYNDIKDMILFGEEHGIDMSASRMLFMMASKKTNVKKA